MDWYWYWETWWETSWWVKCWKWRSRSLRWWSRSPWFSWSAWWWNWSKSLRTTCYCWRSRSKTYLEGVRMTQKTTVFFHTWRWENTRFALKNGDVSSFPCTWLPDGILDLVKTFGLGAKALVVTVTDVMDVVWPALQKYLSTSAFWGDNSYNSISLRKMS